MNSLIHLLMCSENVLEAKAVWSRRRCVVTFKVLPDQVTWRWLDNLYRQLISFEGDGAGFLYRVGPIDFVLADFGDPAILAQQLEGSSEILHL